jgi:hypothetical protein
MRNLLGRLHERSASSLNGIARVWGARRIAATWAREAGIPTPDWVAFNSTAFRALGAG